MNKTLVVTLAVLGGIIVAGLLLGAGLFLGRHLINANNFNPAGIRGQNYAYPGYSMMGRNGMMSGYGMMGANNQRGNYGMMGAYNNQAAAKPVTVDQAKQAVENYFAALNNSDLELKEIMIFSNNAYARIVEKSTGIGAMELLVDLNTLSVYPEYGPNMMWNLIYGHMGSNGMMGGFFGNTSATSQMTVSADQALQLAQQYLDQQFPGYKTAADADPFYGYYTIDILKDGQPTGMLSVNGFSGQVFLHTWHGTFIEMWE